MCTPRFLFFPQYDLTENVSLIHYSNSGLNSMETITNKFSKIGSDLLVKARIFNLIGNKTRLRILSFMFDNKKACVSEIADTLDLSVANISYHLQLLKKGGFFETRRMGNEICYEIIESDFIKKLKQLISI